MKKFLGRIPVLAVTVALSVLGFFLRRHHLRVGFDPNGLPVGGFIWVLAAVCAVSLAIFALAAFGKQKRSSWQENFSRSLPAEIAAVPAAGLLLLGNVLALMAPNPMATPMNLMLTGGTSVLGCIAALCFVGMAAAWHKEKQASSVLAIVPVVYYILRMIFNFKGWSTDPIIVDYCFKLFALIFVMLAVFHVGNFVFDMGKRRLTLFLCLGGVFFSAVSMADGGSIHLLQSAGAALWLLACAWQLLEEKPSEDQ